MFTDNQTIRVLKEFTPEIVDEIFKHAEHTGPIRSDECLPPSGKEFALYVDGAMLGVGKGVFNPAGDFFVSVPATLSTTGLLDYHRGPFRWLPIKEEEVGS